MVEVMAVTLCPSIRAAGLNPCPTTSISAIATHSDHRRRYSSLKGALKFDVLPLILGTISFASRESRCQATLIPEVRKTSFPSFLPVGIDDLEEDAAVQLATRIERLPVQTAQAAEPVMSSCIKPANAGETETPVLLLHGFDSSILEWRRAYPLLEAAGVEPWAMDILGWGFNETGSKSLRFSVEAKRDHMYQFWSTYIKRPMVVVGPSLGGAAALDFALAHPNAVKKLILVDAQGFAEGVGPMGSLPKPLAHAGVSLLKSIWLRSYAQTLAYSDSQLATKDAMRIGRLHTMMPGWADAMVDFMRSGGYNVAAQITELQQEVLLLWGEEDRILDKTCAQRFAQELPNVTLEWVRECGHLPHLEQPQVFTNVVVKFVT